MMLIAFQLRCDYFLYVLTFIGGWAASTLLHLFRFILEDMLMVLCFLLLYAVIAQMPDGVVELVDVES